MAGVGADGALFAVDFRTAAEEGAWRLLTRILEYQRLEMKICLTRVVGP